MGQAEFVGDPWKAKVTADLSQVWKQVRQRYSASVKIGWFNIGSAEYNSLVQELIRKNIIKFEFEESSLDYEKHGRQIFEAAKEVLESINSSATSGKGFFKFEPNPQAADVQGGKHSGFAGWWGGLDKRRIQ